MQRSGLRSLLVSVPENIYYLTGYQTIGGSDQFLLVDLDIEPFLIVRELEAPLVSLTSWSRRVVTYRDEDNPIQIACAALREVLPLGATIGFEFSSKRTSYDVADQLQRNAEFTFRDAGELIERLRATKSVREIEACRRAALLTAAGMTEALTSVEVGKTENDIAAIAAASMIGAGSDWLSLSPIVAAGPRSGFPHANHAKRKLQAGDTVLIELGATYCRYFAPLMRTCVIGQPEQEVLNMYRACHNALETVIDKLGPGLTGGEAHSICQGVIDQAGYSSNFRKQLGYSIGIGFRTWMEPEVMALRPGDSRRIEPGMVFHLPVALRNYGKFGVGVSESVVIKDDGCEVLVSMARDLVVKDPS
jgi:Xaa-Pro dipeptidase